MIESTINALKLMHMHRLLSCSQHTVLDRLRVRLVILFLLEILVQYEDCCSNKKIINKAVVRKMEFVCCLNYGRAIRPIIGHCMTAGSYSCQMMYDFLSFSRRVLVD